MRRLVANLLVALLGFALISPAVFAQDADGSLPACCRRAGKHHCGMMMSESGSSLTPALRTGRCPLFPNSAAAAANSPSTFPPFGIRAAIACVRASAIAQSVPAAYESVHDPATPKRGPPVSF